MVRNRYPKEITLREQPERFREIFGDCRFHEESVRKLLAGMAVVEVKDYLAAVESVQSEEKRVQMARLRSEAERYIFDPLYQPAVEAMSFASVCRFLGIDPGYARKAIRARTPEDLKGIVRRMSASVIDDE